ncbi:MULTISPECIES: condensation domain-containing protein [Rhodococcus]|uniref:Putative non-ribosomal peptide synthetase n=1 Tax=Rhodococcus opacus (strain B4) TaxID=632772 RepID=C1BCR6_RHOOB|nr:MULTISPECIES: condensation domain-containing protein [Rhodococcus]KAF0957472.1 hypothetical protein MLGJGCBP_09304 [Rhodococcus sp. T7]KAF0965049.1 hypothetical protein MLGJGCBP_01801 [Rhodococcus sp. T7]UOT07940.1 condensation domain-containing protein [Rhodococcus opacus]BAH55660.1 putative non-ribosomal peptide synthetase [Rhodococcus opacus B4]
MKWMRRDRKISLDMYDEHLVVSHILRLTDSRCFWYSRAHHIALDGYGAMTLIGRTAELYVAALEQREAPAHPVVHPGQLLDEDLRYQQSDQRRRDRDFWVGETADLPDAVTLGRSSTPGAAAHRVSGAVSARGNALVDRGGSVRRR